MSGKASVREFETVMKEARRDVEVSRPILGVMRADGRLSRALEEAVAPSGLTLPKFTVLMELASTPDGRLPLHEICRRLLKSAPNMSALIDRMERDGLVRRQRDQRDRRVVAAAITKRGWDSLRRGAPAVFAAEKELLKGFSRSELRTLARLLRVLADPRRA